MKTKDLTIMAISLAILIICSKISFNIGIISLTLQTFAVVIISLLLKWKKAAIVFIAYIVMGLIGIPVFSTGGGFQYVLLPSFGFIIGFLPFIIKDLISTVLAALIAIRVEPIVANDNEKVNYIFENEK